MYYNGEERELSDGEIIEMFFDRNESAIEETQKKYGKYCHNIIWNILKNSEDIDECVNDTYLCVWNKIPPERPTFFPAFIAKIARNLALKRYEYNNAQKRKSDMLVSMAELTNDVCLGTDDSDKISEIELVDIINSFLKKEKEIVRNVFIRKYFFFDSIRSIALRYSISESKVKNILFGSRIKLKEYLEKEGVNV